MRNFQKTSQHIREDIKFLVQGIKVKTKDLSDIEDTQFTKKGEIVRTIF